MVFQTISLDSLLRDVGLRARTRNEDTELEIDIFDPGMRIVGDSTRLAQVFDNLFSNAAKYAQNSPIKIEVQQINRNAELKFIDYGPGIPQEYYEGVFQRFFRVPGTLTSVRGSGLGLFICKQIIQAHNGSIYIQPTQGSGTTIVITLPLAPLAE
jgi:signal transduction histidine kinase